MNNNDLAHKIFNALFDDDDLNEMYSAGFIAQPLGYQVSSVATIEVELDNNHDRMMEEIAELREALCDVIDGCSECDLNYQTGLSIARCQEIMDISSKPNQEGEE